MKNLLIYFCLILPSLIFGQNSFSQRNPDILKYRDSIEQLADTTLIILKNEEFINHAYDGGSELKGVFYQGKLVKIMSWFGLSYGVHMCEFYLKEENLYFVVENFKGFKYDSISDEFDYSKFEVFYNGWYLFESLTLKDLETLGHWRFEDDSIDPEKKLVSEFKDYYRLLTEK